MIKVSITKRSGDITIDIKGHAGYAPHGQDIVCAAVSAIAQTAILGLDAVAASYPDFVEVNINDRPVDDLL